MTDKNGLRINNEMTMKEKRFSFFADPQERKAESQPTFGTLPFARHTSQRFAKVKEPNFPLLLTIQSRYFIIARENGLFLHFKNNFNNSDL
jgi:hypothetical protein